MKNEKWWIHVGSARVKFVFAPEERDVYSYECTRKDLAPFGAKPGNRTIGERQQRLRSLETRCSQRRQLVTQSDGLFLQGLESSFFELLFIGCFTLLNVSAAVFE